MTVQAMAQSCMAYDPALRPTCAEMVGKLEVYAADKQAWQVPAELYF
jgi:hypothetical protein